MFDRFLWNASARFVVWGGLHGLYLSAHRIVGAYEPRGRPIAPRLSDLWRIAVTFHLVAFAWIFFRADSLGAAFDYIQGALGRLGSLAAGDGGSLSAQAAGVLVFGVMMFALDWIDRNRQRYRPLATWSPMVLGTALAVIIAALVVFSGDTVVPFIYFQF